MNKYIVTVDTDWCGTDQTYYVESEYLDSVESFAQMKAYDNWLDMGCEDDVALELDLDLEDMTDEEEAAFIERCDDSYHYNIEEFNTTYDDYTWNELIEMDPDNHYILNE